MPRRIRALVASLGLVFGVVFTMAIGRAAPDAGTVRAAADAGMADASTGAEASAEVATSRDPRLLVLEDRSRKLASLLDGTLDVEIDPADILETSLDDESVAVERARVEASTKSLVKIKQPGELLSARLALDRERLAFFELAPEKRAAILAQHEARGVAARTPQVVPADAAPLRAADVVEAERQRLLEEARAARTEAARRVAGERARLAGVQAEQERFVETLEALRADIAQRRELVIGRQRRTHEARAGGSTSAADALYDELRSSLRTALAEIDKAIVDLDSVASSVPRAGADPLTEDPLTAELGDVTLARKEREAIEQRAQQLTREAEAIRRESLSAWLDQADALNRDRLALLPHVSHHKHDEITGFTAVGWSHAVDEARYLWLVLRVHRRSAEGWWRHVRAAEHPLGLLTWNVGFFLAELTILLSVVVWWRRRAPGFLLSWTRRLRERHRKLRLQDVTFAERALAFLARVHGPIEALVAFAFVRRILPGGVRDQLEIELLSIALLWLLCGTLAVTALDALFERSTTSRGRLDQSAALRLRSLRFVGYVATGFGLFLSVSARLVGRGTLFDWISTACWVAAVPVFFVLVRWWRPVVLGRMEALNEKTAFETWVLDHRRGLSSVLGAAAGAVYLFARGVLRTLRAVVLRVEATRKLLAWLFRRELLRREKEQSELASKLGSLSGPCNAALGPEGPQGAWVETALDRELERLAEAIASRRGGIVALVGGFGMGKSAALSRLVAKMGTRAQTARMEPARTSHELLVQLRDRLNVDGAQSLDELAVRLATLDIDAVILDDAERIVRPMMGGLESFDALLGAARRHAGAVTWVLAFDATVWQFLIHARGLHPLFDHVIELEPWDEGDIVDLLESRSRQAGVDPDFSQLLDRGLHLADETERREALLERRGEYGRLVWDYAAGNPGLALDVWRRSLATLPSGAVVVNRFPSLDTTALERLPDTAAFVFRAIMQMHPALEDDVARATRLPPNEIADALRYGLTHGFLERSAQRYQVTWTWRRAVQLFLERKHLLVT